jgi:hypothetical protein
MGMRCAANMLAQYSVVLVTAALALGAAALVFVARTRQRPHGVWPLGNLRAQPIVNRKWDHSWPWARAPPFAFLLKNGASHPDLGRPSSNQSVNLDKPRRHSQGPSTSRTSASATVGTLLAVGIGLEIGPVLAVRAAHGGRHVSSRAI